MAYQQLLPVHFTSREEIERQFSIGGVEWHTDHTEDDHDIILEIIERTTADFKAVLNKLFKDEDLAKSVWVRDRATTVAVYKLSILRGNTDVYGTRYYEIMDELQRLIEGELYIAELPRDIGTPIVMQNYISDNRTPHQPLRVDMVSSSAIGAGQTNLKHYRPFLW